MQFLLLKPIPEKSMIKVQILRCFLLLQDDIQKRLKYFNKSHIDALERYKFADESVNHSLYEGSISVEQIEELSDLEPKFTDLCKILSLQTINFEKQKDVWKQYMKLKEDLECFQKVTQPHSCGELVT